MKQFICTTLLFVLIGCVGHTPPQPVPGATLDVSRVSPGEQVQLKLTNMDTTKLSIKLDGQTIQPSPLNTETLGITLPSDLTPGEHKITLTYQGTAYEYPIGVLGQDVLPGKATAIIKAGTSLTQIKAVLNQKGYTVEDLESLGGQEACGQLIADLDVGDVSLGKALADLEKEDFVLSADPRSGYSAGTINYSNIIHSNVPKNQNLTGEGITIAILDTGVSPHPELGNRLLPGYNYVSNTTNAQDNFDDPATDFQGDGHGTPAAVLAAGSTSGLAPKAQVLPVKVCDDQGSCLSSHAIKGLCYALNQTSDPHKLVINLSLGGSTPIHALETVLDYAASQGALISTSAGNQGEQGSPVHYPAAFAIEGLLAVAAAEPAAQPPQNCLTYTNFTPQSYPVGTALTEQGIKTLFEAYQTADSMPVTTGEASITASNSAGGTSPELTLKKIRATIMNLNAEHGFSLQFKADIATNSMLRYQLTAFDSSEVFQDVLTISPPTQNLDLDIVVDLAAVWPEAQIAGMLRYNPITQQGSLTIHTGAKSLSIDALDITLDNICLLQPSPMWKRADFSTVGSYVDIAAPGSGLQSGTPSGGYYDSFQGTSFAAPIVAGALALWREVYPTLDAGTIETYVKNAANSDLFASPNPDEIGAGMLDLSVLGSSVP